MTAFSEGTQDITLRLPIREIQTTTVQPQNGPLKNITLRTYYWNFTVIRHQYDTHNNILTASCRYSVCVCVFSPWFVFFVLLLVPFFGCFRYLFIYLFLFLFIFSCIDAEKTQQSCYLLNFLTRNPEVMEFKLDSSSGLCFFSNRHPSLRSFTQWKCLF